MPKSIHGMCSTPYHGPLLLQVDLKVMFGESWHVLRKVLTHDTDRALTAYWDRVRAEEQEGQLVSPSAEVSTLAPPKSNPG